jgi:hypothetical protein
MNDLRSAWGVSAVALVMTATIAFAQVGLDSPKGNKTATNRPDSPVRRPDSRLKAQASTAALQSSKQVSNAWYILSQTDCNGLLHGLPARLAQALVGRRGPARLNVEIELEGIDDGEIVLGFFTDPRWWIAEPTTIRRVHGRGKHLLEGLPAGRFVIGAMMGTPPDARALGVHQTWPEAVSITEQTLSQTRVRVSKQFKDAPGWVPEVDWSLTAVPKPKPPGGAVVRILDETGEPLPLARVTFVDRDEKETRAFHEAVTGWDGTASSDKVPHSFSVMAQRFDFLPATMTCRWYHRKVGRLERVGNPGTVKVTLPAMPAGNGTLSGRVQDQNGRPLKEYFLSLTQQINGERLGWGEAASHCVQVPVISADGRYQIGDLPAGTYRVTVRHFDYVAYAWSFDGPEVTIPTGKGAVAKLDIEIEAKELRYGRALYADGTPLARGGYFLQFNRPQWGQQREGFAERLGADGSFRIALSKEERRQLIEATAGLIEITSPDWKQKDQVSIEKLSPDTHKPTVLKTKIKPPLASN